MTRTIAARRAGECPQCGGPILRGAPIAAVPNRSSAWAHVACVEQYRRDVAADDLDALTYGYGR
jgi:hypothetical protein